MYISGQDKEGVQIQIKPIGEGKSKSFTIHNTDTDEVFNRIYFLFEQLSTAKENNIKIIHYKKKDEE